MSISSQAYSLELSYSTYSSLFCPKVYLKKNIQSVEIRQQTTLTVRKNYRRAVNVRAAGNAPESTAVSQIPADSLVNAGLKLYKKGKVNEALSKFNAALEQNPTPEEAQAALYNKACCHAYREEGKETQKALREALGKYGLKFSLILSDPDMAPFRATPEFAELQTEARLGGADIGSGFRNDLKLISEVRAPFRGVRKFLYLGLGAAAGISTLFTIPRVVQSLGGGEGAPNLVPSLTNLAINIGGGAILVALYLWDQKKEEEQMAKIQRDETLSRLPVRLSNSRVVELSQLRETARPLILAGTKQEVEKAMRQADRFRSELLERGIVLVPVVWGQVGSTPQKGAIPASKLPPKRGFGGGGGKSAGVGPAPIVGRPQESVSLTADEFEERAREMASKRTVQVERKFKAEAVSPGEWQQWVRQQQEAEGVKPGEDVYLVLRLDGRLRKSGRGMPDWVQIVRDVPPLDDLVSKLER